MTIDSDSDQGGEKKVQKKAGKGVKRPAAEQIVKAEDEDIAINKEFQLDDLVDYTGKSRASTLTQGAKFENKTLWSYQSAVKTDSSALRLDPITGEPETTASKLLTLEERIHAKLEEHGVNILETGLINANAPELG